MAVALPREVQWAGRCCVEARNRCPVLFLRRSSVRVVPSSLGGRTILVSWGVREKKSSRRRRRNSSVGVCCAATSLYETLGVAETATEKEIKRAYRGLALKFHPDVNKQPGAQEKFLEIKNAYQTLVDRKTRDRYDASRRTRSNDWDPFQWGSSSTSGTSGRRSTQEDEEFYGIGDLWKDLQGSLDGFVRDVQSDLKRRSAKRSAKPKSLWEELADIGEEFVEFLEKELNISDEDEDGSSSRSRSSSRSSKAKSNGENRPPPEADRAKKVENELAEIEDMLAQLKKEMGR